MTPAQVIASVIVKSGAPWMPLLRPLPFWPFDIAPGAQPAPANDPHLVRTRS